MEQKLVSVIIDTYNSADTITDILNSVERQTYKNIELIITDDCSTDNTLQVIDKWLEMYGKRFVSVHVEKSLYNTGVTNNARRGILCSHGEFIKEAGGDDMLMKDCIQANVEYYNKTGIELIFSRQEFCGCQEIIERRNLYATMEKVYKIIGMDDQEEKRKTLFFHFGVPSVTAFYTRKLYERLGGYDSKYPFWEDGPFYYKVLETETDIGFVDKVTMISYVREKSLSNNWMQKVQMSYSGFMNLRDYVRGFLRIRIPGLLKRKAYKTAIIECYGMLCPALLYLKVKHTYGRKYMKRYKLSLNYMN